MALLGLVGPVDDDRGELHISGDLVEKLGQHRRVPNVTIGDLNGADLQRLFVNTDVDIAP